MTAAATPFVEGMLSGQVALVTGGGTNLGRAAAQELLRCGATVVIAGRREEVLAEAVDSMRPPAGGTASVPPVDSADHRISAVSGDIRDPEDARRIVRDVLARHGRLDFLLNNAGGQYFVPAESITPKGWSAVQRLNVEGTLHMCEAAHEAMTDGGAIVNVTVSQHHGFPAMAHTGAARAAVEAATRDLAEAWRPDGVSVSAIALGRFATDSLKKYPAELWKRAAEGVPLQRLGEMEEYGWLVALLASPLGRRFSGTVLTLDGAMDNWPGAWPPPDLSRDGEVPTEERRPANGPAQTA